MERPRNPDARQAPLAQLRWDKMRDPTEAKRLGLIATREEGATTRSWIPVPAGPQVVRVKQHRPAPAVPAIASQGAARNGTAAALLLGVYGPPVVDTSAALGRRAAGKDTVLLAVDTQSRLFPVLPKRTKQVAA